MKIRNQIDEALDIAFAHDMTEAMAGGLSVEDKAQEPSWQVAILPLNAPILDLGRSASVE
jgi:hypothetical protein